MTLGEYVKKRNGVPFGHSKSLRNNLYRSLGAKNFSAFWSFWNPIFGYYLGTKIFKPLKKILPIAVALILTFIICGLVHDLVTTLFRKQFSLFFSVWFLLIGIAVMLTKIISYNLSQKPWLIRASANILILALCALVTILLNHFFNFY